MGNRISKVTTRTGDDGTTGLGDGSRVAKDDPRVTVLGDIDELNSAIGLVLALVLPEDLRGILTRIQHVLFDLGGELAVPGSVKLELSASLDLERHIARLNLSLPALREFILPGGNQVAACAHLARAVCRRAERSLVALAALAVVNREGIVYLNRLSDLLFVMARVLNRGSGEVAEVYWTSERLEDDADNDPA